MFLLLFVFVPSQSGHAGRLSQPGNTGWSPASVSRDGSAFYYSRYVVQGLIDYHRMIPYRVLPQVDLTPYFWNNGFGFVLGDVKTLATGRDPSYL